MICLYRGQDRRITVLVLLKNLFGKLDAIGFEIMGKGKAHLEREKVKCTIMANGGANTVILF